MLEEFWKDSLMLKMYLMGSVKSIVLEWKHQILQRGRKQVNQKEEKGMKMDEEVSYITQAFEGSNRLIVKK